MNGHGNRRHIGLARTLSKLGYCSRSQAFELIRAGHVSVNGKIQRNPETPVHPESACIQVDGQEIPAAGKIYLMLNKPRGIVTTASDEKGRETVYEFLPEGLPWVAPAGRLDKGSEGLLLLTNDSEWAARITAPETHLDKTYHVQIGSVAEESLIQRLTSGMKTTGGVLRAKRASILRRGEKNTWLEIVLDEGKNRQIRRMLDAVEIDVLRLVRVAIGPLILGDLAKGNSRQLTAAEKQRLDQAMAGRRNFRPLRRPS